MRRALAGLGAVAVLVGLFVSFQQEFAGLFPGNWIFVLLIAVAAGIQSVSTVLARRRTPIYETETGDPERRYEAPTPGDDLHELMGFASNRSRGANRSRDQVRERLVAVAAAAIADAEGCPESEAHDRIEDGEWTDDPVAAWFLSRDVGLAPAERARLLAAAPFSQYEAAFDRTVRVVDEIASGGGR
ncbi:DUF7269 family protein [Halolamina sediminis]|jgi:hypothetical protein|uniref:DUF7269 family protein n=1 Tax=Halolamina sediminis TaxID=1480675 RepID=UPI0006B62F43|nr:hypothetical protein [Halolamina sediminis]